MVELIALFWVADVMNLPFMAMFDTVYELNTAFWFWGWLMIMAVRSGRDDNQ